MNRGRPRAGDGKAVAVREARKVAAGIKGSVFALGKAPENLTDGQRARLGMIRSGDPKLYRAYRLKESLRLLPETTDADQDETDLKHWLWWASHSRIPASGELYAKIKRRKEHIPDTIRLGTGNARVEARNNKIKLIIRKAYGFRNIGNMMDMIYRYAPASTSRFPIGNQPREKPHDHRREQQYQPTRMPEEPKKYMTKDETPT